MKRHVWVTKYALTEGITRCCVESVSNIDSKYVYVHLGSDKVFKTQCIMGRSAFDTEREANARAFEMVQAKLRSIARQKSKLETLASLFAGKAKSKTAASRG